MTEKTPRPPTGGLNPQVLGEGGIIDQTQNHPGNLEWSLVLNSAHRINEMINVDPKTGLLNERSYTRALGETIKSLRPGDELYVGAVDVNGFKAVNDALGHPKGDEFLGIVGGVLLDVYKRGGGIAPPDANPDNPENIARISGDEFAFFWVERVGEETSGKEARTELAELSAQRQAQRANDVLHERIEGTEFAECCDPSLANGLVKYEDGDTVETLIAKADIAMYKMKLAKHQDLNKRQARWIHTNAKRIESFGMRVPNELKDAAALALGLAA